MIKKKKENVSTNSSVSKENVAKIQKGLASGETIALSFEYAKKSLVSIEGTISVTTKNGIIKIAATAEQYAALSKTFGALGQISNASEMFDNVGKYRDGEISGARLTYRLTGETASFFSGVLADAALGSEAGPYGTVAGIAIGVLTPVGELVYDNVVVPAANTSSDFLHKYLIDPLAHFESSLGSGWLPH
jgi:hypothetical protein